LHLSKKPWACTTEELLDIQGKFLATFLIYGLQDLFVFSPYVDNILLKQQPIDVKIDKPVIVGNNSDEATLFISAAKPIITPLTYGLLLIDIFGLETATKIVSKKRYSTNKQDAYTALNNVVNDSLFVCGSHYLLDNADTDNAEAFSFDYTYVSSFNFYPYVPLCADEACHGAELPFVFDNPLDAGSEVTFSADDKKMAQEMGSFWIQFIKNHKPGRVGNDIWKAYPDNGRYILTSDLPDNYTTDRERNCDFWTTELYSTGKTKAAVSRLLDNAYLQQP
jgi:carboxylesterase type B